MRYFLDISYKGTNYHGWQVQDNAHSVQAELERALGVFLRHEVNSIGSGRTDTGVHAKQQFVHFDSEIKLTMNHILNLNSILPKDIVINHIYTAPETASARFDALDRSYEYYINKKENPFIRETSYFYPRPLDITLMNRACEIMKKKTDFQCFSKVKTHVENFNCDIKTAYFVENDSQIVFFITANRFLRGMVRAIMGTMIDLGTNKIDLNDFEEIISGKDRRKAGHAVPPEGLFLSKINYPDFLTKV